MRYSLLIVSAALFSLSCGNDSIVAPDSQQPGVVPTPTQPVIPSPSPSPSMSGRDWRIVTLASSPCPPPQPDEPACLAAITLWSVNDEGEILPGPKRLSQQDLLALDQRIDAVKNAGELVCTGGMQGDFNKAVSLRFEDGSNGQFYTLNTGTSQECYRASLESSRALLTELEQLKVKYNGQ